MTHEVGRDDEELAVRPVALGMGWDAEPRDMKSSKSVSKFPTNINLWSLGMRYQNFRKFSGIPEIIHYSVFFLMLYVF